MAHNVTLIPGDGIGPEVALAARRVVDASGAEINWHVVDAGESQMAQYGTPLPQHVLDLSLIHILNTSKSRKLCIMPVGSMQRA